MNGQAQAMAPAKKHRRSDELTAGQWWLSGAAAVLMLGLAGLAFRGMFTSVRLEMVPFFGSIAWIVPIGVDLGIVVLLLVGILLEWLAMPMPALRWIAEFFMACSAWLNVSAALGHVNGIIGHLALPVLFVASVEAVRHAVRRRSGLAAGTIREGIPATRWLLAPCSSFMIWRRMVLWQVTSYRTALDREQLRRRMIARLRAEHGSKWKVKADSAVVWQLVNGIDVEAAATVLMTPPDPPPDAPESTPRGRQKTRHPARQEPATGRATDRARAHAKARRLMAADPPPQLADVAAKTGLSPRTLSRIKNQPPARPGLSAVPSNPGA